MRDLAEPIVTIVTAIIGVAIIATLVSSRAQTPGVLSAFGSMIANMLSAATGPVTGAVTAPNVSGPSSFGSLGNLQMPSTPVNG